MIVQGLNRARLGPGVVAIACVVAAGTASAATYTFVNDISATDAGSSQVTFDEFGLGDAVGPAPTPVPTTGLTIDTSTGFQVGDLVGSTLDSAQVTGLFEGNFLFQPAGSTLGGTFEVSFATPVSEAGLGLFNNFGAIERYYNLKVFDASDTMLAEELAIPVIASAEFLGFTSDMANISRLELGFGPTFNTGQRPLVDSITYFSGSTPPPPPSAIPLPAGLPLYVIGAAVFGLGRRRRISTQA